VASIAILICPEDVVVGRMFDMKVGAYTMGPISGYVNTCSRLALHIQISGTHLGISDKSRPIEGLLFIGIHSSFSEKLGFVLGL
jgi:hypothetical protein